MDEAVVRQHAEAHCAALRDGDIEQAAQELSNELRGNPRSAGSHVPMPLTEPSVESVDRTGSGFRAVLHLVGESAATRLETRWKERDGRLVIVELSHLTDQAVGEPGASETTEPNA